MSGRKMSLIDVPKIGKKIKILKAKASALIYPNGLRSSSKTTAKLMASKTIL